MTGNVWKRPISDRFWEKVRKYKEDGACWTWLASVWHGRYGGFKLDGHHTVAAHRAAWQITYGPIPKGMNVLHHCDNPICVRPDHLFLGTDMDNVQDAIRKGRFRTDGEYSGRAKLTYAQAQEIRERYAARNITTRKLAKEYGISHSTVIGVINWVTYRKPPQWSCDK